LMGLGRGDVKNPLHIVTTIMNRGRS